MTGGALLLAAGNSQRFGSDKRLYVESQLPMLVTTVQIYQQVFEHLAVVIRPDEDGIVKLLAENGCRVKIITAKQANRGMGHSLSAGINQIKHWDYVFIGLADMPYVQPTSLEKIHQSLVNCSHIVQPTFAGVRGHPVGFGGDYFTKLQQVSGDKGAKELIDAHPDNVLFIEIDDVGITRDKDLPD